MKVDNLHVLCQVGGGRGAAGPPQLLGHVAPVPPRGPGLHWPAPRHLRWVTSTSSRPHILTLALSIEASRENLTITEKASGVVVIGVFSVIVKSSRTFEALLAISILVRPSSAAPVSGPREAGRRVQSAGARTRRHPSLSLFQPMDTITAAIHSRQHQHRHKKVVISKQRQTSLTCLLVSRRRPRRRG